MGGVVSGALAVYSYLGGKKGERKASQARAAGTRSDMQGYWETYQKWGQEAATDYERNITGTKARMAASGIKAGSGQWETILANITSEYEKQVEGFDTGVTGSALTDWAEQQQQQLRGRRALEEGEVAPEFTPLGTTEYLTQEFGALDLAAAAPSAKEKASSTARQAAAGTAPSTGPTSTPWW